MDDGPAGRLVGVAVGPVQGMLDEGGWEISDDGGEGGGDNLADTPRARMETRRWRIILHYSNQNVKCFEVGKYSRPGEMRLADLVV